MNKKKCLTMMLAFLALGMTGLEAQKAMPLKVEAKAVAVSAAGDKAQQAEAVLRTDGTPSRQRLNLGNPSAPAVAFDKLAVAPQTEAVQHTDRTITRKQLNLGNPSAPAVAFDKQAVAQQVKAGQHTDKAVALSKLPLAPQARATTRTGETFSLTVLNKSPNIPSTIKQNEDGQLELTIANTGSTAFEDSVFVMLANADDENLYMTDGVNVTVPASGEVTVQIPYNVGYLSPGDYDMFIFYIGDDGSPYVIYFEDGSAYRSVSVEGYDLTVLDESNIPSAIRRNVDGQLEVTIGNTGNMPFEGSVCMALVNGSNNILYLTTEVDVTVPASGEQTVQISYNVISQSWGTCNLVICYVGSDGYYMIPYEDGSSYRSVTLLPDQTVLDKSPNIPSTFKQHDDGQLEVTIGNTGSTAFESYVYMLLTGDEDDNIEYSTVGIYVTVPASGEATVQIPYNVNRLAPGAYDLVICYEDDNNNIRTIYFEDGSAYRNVDVQANPTVLGKSPDIPSTINQYEDGQLEVTIGNTGSTAFEGRMVMMLLDDDYNNVYNTIIVNATIPASGEATVQMPYNVDDLTPGTYALCIGYVGDDDKIYLLYNEDGSWYRSVSVAQQDGPDLSLLMAESTFPETVVAQGEFTVQATIANAGADFDRPLSVAFVDSEGYVVYETEAVQTTIARGATVQLTFKDTCGIDLDAETLRENYYIRVIYYTAGRYQMVAPDTGREPRVTVTHDPATNPVLTLVRDESELPDMLYAEADTLTVCLQNTGGADFDGELCVYLTDEDNELVYYSDNVTARVPQGGGKVMVDIPYDLSKVQAGTYGLRVAEVHDTTHMYSIPTEEGIYGFWVNVDVRTQFSLMNDVSGSLMIGGESTVEFRLHNALATPYTGAFFFVLYDEAGEVLYQSEPDTCTYAGGSYANISLAAYLCATLEGGTYPIGVGYLLDGEVQMIPLAEGEEQPTVEVRPRFQQGSHIEGTLLIGEDASVEVDIQDNSDEDFSAEEFCLLLQHEDGTTAWQSEPMKVGKDEVENRYSVFTCNVGSEIARGTYYVRVGHCTADGMYIIPWEDGLEDWFEFDPSMKPYINVRYPIEQGSLCEGTLLIGEDTEIELDLYNNTNKDLSTEEFYLLLQDEEGTTVWQSEPMKGERENEWDSRMTFTCNVGTEIARGTYYVRVALRTEDELIPLEYPTRRPTIDVRYRLEWEMEDGNLVSIAQGGSDEISIQLRNYGETYNGSMYLQLCDEDGAVKYTGSPQQVEVGSSTYLYYTLNVPATWAVGTYQLRLAYVSGGLKYAGYYDENDEDAVPQVEVFDPSLPMLIGGRMLLNGGYEDEIIPGQDYYVGIDLYNSGAAYNGNVCMVLSDEAGTIHYQTRSKPADVRSEGYFSDTIHFVVGTDVMPGVYRMNAAYPSDGELQIIPNDDNATVEVLDPNVPRLRLNSLASDGLLAPDADFELEANLVNRGGDFNGGLYIQMLDTYGEPVYQSPATNVQLQRGATAQVTLTGHVAAATALGDYQLCVIYDPDGGSDLERIPFVDEYEEYPWVRVIDPSVPLLNLSYLMSGDGTTEYQPGASMMMLAGVTNVFDGNVGVNLFLVLYDQAGRMVYQNEAQWVEIQAGSSPDLLFLGTLDASITPGTYRLAIAYEVGTQLYDIPLADGSGTGIEITVLGEGTGLGMNSEAGFTCYPNPATTHVNIRAEGGMERVLLHSLSGMLLIDEDGHGEAAYRLDLDRLPQGTYLLTVETPDATYTQRIIKE